MPSPRGRGARVPGAQYHTRLDGQPGAHTPGQAYAPNLMWNGPVKSGSAELAELLFGAFEREGLGFFQN